MDLSTGSELAEAREDEDILVPMESVCVACRVWGAYHLWVLAGLWTTAKSSVRKRQT